MTPAQIELTLRCAERVLVDRDAGRHRDPETIEWAEQIVAGNARPKVQPPLDHHLERQPT